MGKYRKRPVVIDAFQTDEAMDIETLEGVMHASAGDYIITGVNGERYPCKPDIFAKTYEPADEQPTDSPDQITDKQICTGLIKLLLRRNPAGGILHIVLDDLNVEDDYIYLCVLKIAKLVDQGTNDNTIYLANTICMYLADMSDAERLECIRNAKGN